MSNHRDCAEEIMQSFLNKLVDSFGKKYLRDAKNFKDTDDLEICIRKYFPPSVPSLTIPAPKSVDIINDLLYNALRMLIEDLKGAPMERHTNREIAERLEYLIAKANT